MKRGLPLSANQHVRRAVYRCAPAHVAEPACNYHCIYNYTADAGLGLNAARTPSGFGCRCAARLGTVAAGDLWVAAPRVPRAGQNGRTLTDPVATCQGDQSDGIANSVGFYSGYTTRYINSLSLDVSSGDPGVVIRPGPGIGGIYVKGAGAGRSNCTLFSQGPHYR